MADGFYGPGDQSTANQGETISTNTRSKVLNLGKLPEKYVEVSTTVDYDGTIDFMVSFDNPPPATASASINWVDVPYVDLSATTNAPATGAFSPGRLVRKVYKILGHGRMFSVLSDGITRGSFTWRLIATENSGGLSQGLGSAQQSGTTRHASPGFTERDPTTSIPTAEEYAVAVVAPDGGSVVSGMASLLEEMLAEQRRTNRFLSLLADDEVSLDDAK